MKCHTEAWRVGGGGKKSVQKVYYMNDPSKIMNLSVAFTVHCANLWKVEYFITLVPFSWQMETPLPIVWLELQPVSSSMLYCQLTDLVTAHPISASKVPKCLQQTIAWRPLSDQEWLLPNICDKIISDLVIPRQHLIILFTLWFNMEQFNYFPDTNLPEYVMKCDSHNAVSGATLWRLSIAVQCLTFWIKWSDRNAIRNHSFSDFIASEPFGILNWSHLTWSMFQAIPLTYHLLSTHRERQQVTRPFWHLAPLQTMIR